MIDVGEVDSSRSWGFYLSRQDGIQFGTAQSRIECSTLEVEDKKDYLKVCVVD